MDKQKDKDTRKETADSNSSSSKSTDAGNGANDHNYSSNETSSSTNSKANASVSSSNNKDAKDDEHVVSQGGRPKKRIKSVASNESVTSSSSSSSSSKTPAVEQVSSASSSKKSSVQRNQPNKKEASSSSQISSNSQFASNQISSSSKEEKSSDKMDADQSGAENENASSSTSEESAGHSRKQSALSSTTPLLSSKEHGAGHKEQPATDSTTHSLPRVPPLRIVINNSSTSSKKDSGEKLVSSSSSSSTLTASVSLANVSQIHSTNSEKSFSIENHNQSTNSLAINVTSSSAIANTSATSVGLPVANSLDELDGDENASSSKDLSNLTGASTGRVTRSSQRAAAQQSSVGDEKETTSKEGVPSKRDESSDAGGKGQEAASGKDLRKRKNRFKANQSSSANQSKQQQHSNQEDDDDSTSSSNSSVNNKELNQLVNSQLQSLERKQFQMPSYNCYHLYLNIRRQVDHRRTQQTAGFGHLVHPKMPDNFNQFLFTTGSYLLDKEGKEFAASNGEPRGADKSQELILSLKNSPDQGSAVMPKNLIGTSMHSLFVEQDLERRKLALQHRIEKDKLRLSAEQEILRVYARAELAMANLNLPLLSACTVLKDEDIYNSIDEENDGSLDNNELLFNHEPNEFANPSLNNVNVAPNGESPGKMGKAAAEKPHCDPKLLNAWLQDVNDKWNRIKRDILLRQKREAESLQAIQKLNWQWKGKDLDFYDGKTTNATNLYVEDSYVPSVRVEDDISINFCQ